MLSEEVKTKIIKILEAYGERSVPIMVRDKVVLQFRFRGNDVVLFEKRPAFRKPGVWVDCNVARFRFHPPTKKWSLRWRDRNDRWHPYEEFDPSPSFEAALAEVDRDPTGIFWG